MQAFNPSDSLLIGHLAEIPLAELLEKKLIAGSSVGAGIDFAVMYAIDDGISSFHVFLLPGLFLSLRGRSAFNENLNWKHDSRRPV